MDIIVQTRIMVHGEVMEPLYLIHQGLHLVTVGGRELNRKLVVIDAFRGKVIIIQRYFVLLMCDLGYSCIDSFEIF